MWLYRKYPPQLFIGISTSQAPPNINNRNTVHASQGAYVFEQGFQYFNQAMYWFYVDEHFM